MWSNPQQELEISKCTSCRNTKAFSNFNLYEFVALIRCPILSTKLTLSFAFHNEQHLLLSSSRCRQVHGQNSLSLQILIMASCFHKPNRWRYSLSMSNVHSSRAYCALPVATKAISKTLLSTNSSYFLVVTTEPIVISPLFCASGTACYLPRPPFCYLATKPFSISPASAAKMIRLEDQPVVVSLVRGSNSSRRSICPTCRHIGVEVGAEREL